MLDKNQIQDWEGAPEDAPKKPAGRAPSYREAVPTGETVTLTPEQSKARKRRSQWLALGLFAFVIIIFTLTMTKMGANILVRDL